MPPLDAEIDRLYRLPLPEFTAARNALAARAGDRRAAVKSLQKPNTAAWAINQLYWQRKPLYDELIRASERLRAAHARTLSGKKADVTDAETAHAAALKRAADEVQALLAEAGERASPQVMNDVRETLQALPSDDPPGRLTRPLQPLGFGALLAMLPAAARSKLSAVEPAERTAADTRGARGATGHDADRHERTAAGKKQAEAEANRAAAERQKRRAALERELKEARAAERESAAALAKARAELERAEREQQRRQAALEEQKFEVRRLGGEVAELESRAKAGSDARAAIEASLADL